MYRDADVVFSHKNGATVLLGNVMIAKSATKLKQQNVSFVVNCQVGLSFSFVGFCFFVFFFLWCVRKWTSFLIFVFNSTHVRFDRAKIRTIFSKTTATFATCGFLLVIGEAASVDANQVTPVCSSIFDLCSLQLMTLLKRTEMVWCEPLGGNCYLFFLLTDFVSIAKVLIHCLAGNVDRNDYYFSHFALKLVFFFFFFLRAQTRRSSSMYKFFFF